MSVVGLTAGASAPPAVVSEIIDALSGLGTVTVTERVTTTESVQFGLPREVAASGKTLAVSPASSAQPASAPPPASRRGRG